MKPIKSLEVWGKMTSKAANIAGIILALATIVVPIAITLIWKLPEIIKALSGN